MVKQAFDFSSEIIDLKYALKWVQRVSKIVNRMGAKKRLSVNKYL